MSKEIEIETLLAMNPDLIPGHDIDHGRCATQASIGLTNKDRDYNAANDTAEQPVHMTRQQMRLQQQQQKQPQQYQTPAPAAGNKGRRRNVERRQRQAEMPAEMRSLLSMDPGKPNRECSAMIRPLRQTDPVEDQPITVSISKRPLNMKEIQCKEVDVISVPTKNQLVVYEPKIDPTKFLENQHFRSDYIFDDKSTNELVYWSPQYRGHQEVSSSFFEIYGGKALFDLLANKAKQRVLEDARQQVQMVGITEKVDDDDSVEEELKLVQHGKAAQALQYAVKPDHIHGRQST